MVGSAERTVSKPAADGHYLYVCMVITNVIAYLLEATKHREICNGVGEDDFAAKCHAGRDPGHVLFRYAGVEKAIGESAGERFDNAESEVANNQVNPVVAFRQCR